MDSALLIARLVLAAVFLVAGIAKLFDRPGSESGLKGFGLPASVAKPGSVILPIVEIVIGALLIPESTAWYAAIAALVLLAIFCIGIAWNMVQGKQPDCHCFGQLHSGPAGWRTLIRNLVLGAVALFLVLYGGDAFSFSHGNAGYSIMDWFTDLSGFEQVVTIVGILSILLLFANTWVVYHLLGQNGRVLLRLDQLEQGLPADVAMPIGGAAATGLAVGSAAPAFKLEGLHGETMTLDALRSGGKPTLLMFMDPNCGPCNALMPDIGKWTKEYAQKLSFAFITRGTAEANQAKAREHGITNVLLQQNREVAEQYDALATPSAVLVQADGKIGSPVAAGADSIRQLVARASGTVAAAAAPAPAPAPVPAPAPAAAPQRRSGLDIGSLAPGLSLPDLAGETVSLEKFKGSPAMLLFWNPGCGFCKRMTDELKAWEQSPPEGAPKMLIVSTGTPEANKELGLGSTLVLDEGFNTGRAFGASGTPSAVLIDAQGKIASDIAVGAPAVMAIANNQK